MSPRSLAQQNIENSLIRIKRNEKNLWLDIASFLLVFSCLSLYCSFVTLVLMTIHLNDWRKFLAIFQIKFQMMKFFFVSLLFKLSILYVSNAFSLCPLCILCVFKMFYLFEFIAEPYDDYFLRLGLPHWFYGHLWWGH